ncbi:MAG TPA: NADH-quinone oxidoreductase subunit H [Elusimicrobiales bacterium]|nr:NADH-quinone oxidoreductase subunit H [Elusimicrobiales bacterium]
MEQVLTAAHYLVIAAAAPFFSGLIKKVKNLVRLRRGAPLLQPYYNLLKLLSKDGEVVSEHASWLFTAAPYVVFSSSAAALMLVPLFGRAPFGAGIGDMAALLFILALGRFFTALAGMDAGSAFGGMGSSREMFISSLAEPAAMVSILVLALKAGSTSSSAAAYAGAQGASTLTAALALFIVALAETSRIPVDNQETHLELTMVHEAMVLEYSGRSLALMEYSSHLRQMVWLSLIAGAVFPLPCVPGCGVAAASAAHVFFAVKLAALALLTAFTEVSMAKIRLFRVGDLMLFALAAALTSAALAAGGF